MTKSLRNSRKRKVVTTKFSKNDLAFIEFVKQECKRVGIKCDLRPTKYVRMGNIRCSGYFDSDGKMLVCSMNRPDSLGILVHEYCHLTQWEDGIPLWKASDSSLTKVDEWLGGKRVHNIKRHLAASRDLELDNEKRSVRMIRKWKLSIDVADYIKKANAYVHFYNWMYYTRKWSSPKNSPYTNPIVQGVMSTRFNMKYSELSPRVYNAFKEAKI